MKSLKVICFLLIFSALSCSSKTVKVDNLDVFTNIESLSEYLADKIIENDKQKGYLKIVFFPIINEDKQFKLLGYHISNQIKTSLFKEKKYDLLERIQLEYILKELELTNTSSLFSQENITKAGKFLGANAVLLGDISDMGKYFNINIQLVSVEQAKIISISNAKLLADSYRKQFETDYTLDSKNNVITKFYLTVKSAEILVPMDNGSPPDSYGYIYALDKTYTLSKVQDSYKPIWNTKFEIELSDEKPLTIKLIDKDVMKDDLITTFIISKKDLLSKLDKNGNFTFEDARAKLFINVVKIK